MACLYCKSVTHEMANCPVLYPRGNPLLYVTPTLEEPAESQAPAKPEIIELSSPNAMAEVIAASKRLEPNSLLQDQIIDAVEKACSAKQATGHASYQYNLGYAEAKRDVLIEIARVFTPWEEEPRG